MIYSQFNYGHNVTTNANIFPIDEGSGIILVEIPTRAYSLQDFATELNRALNAQLTNNYNVIVNRNGNFLTIESDSVFTIPLTSYPNYEITIYELVGFPPGPDLTGQLVYTAPNKSGKIFSPQFELQNFRDFKDSQKAANASVNQSASGRVEVIKFGNVRIMTCNITLQTNITQTSGCNPSPIRPDPHGVENLRDFMEYAITKAPIEFVRNDLLPDEFTKCILESTASDSDGVGFELIQLYSRGLVGYFETGPISFREIR